MICFQPRCVNSPFDVFQKYYLFTVPNSIEGLTQKVLFVIRKWVPQKILPWWFSLNWIYKLLYMTFWFVGWLVVEFRSIVYPRDLGLKDEFPLCEVFLIYPSIYFELYDENHGKLSTAMWTNATEDWIRHLSSNNLNVGLLSYWWGYMFFWIYILFANEISIQDN